MRGSILCLLALCIAPESATAFQPATPGQSATDPTTAILELVKDLDSPSLETRTAASDRLLRDPAATLRQIEGILLAPPTPLSPEQRQRLLAAAYARFRTGPRGAMGIRNDFNVTSHGVVLVFLVQGFNAAEVLRIGDRIIAAGGVPIDTWETLRAVIVSRDPGDEVPVTVVREGATLHLKIGLGDYGRLDQPGTLEGTLMTNAWALRSKPLRGEDQQPAIETGLPAATWSSHFNPALPDEPVQADDGGNPLASGERANLTAGGEARGGMMPRMLGPARQMNIRVMPGNQPPGLIAPQDPAQLARAQIDAIRALIDDLQIKRAALNERLRRPGLGDAESQQLNAELESLERQLQMRGEQVLQLQRQFFPRRRRGRGQ